MAALRCTVATPTRELFSGEIFYASIPGVEGSYGVLPGHETLVATNAAGGVLSLDLDAEGKEKKQFLIFGGAAQVHNDMVIVLGRFGKDVEEIDVEELREKIENQKLKVEELEREFAIPGNDEQDEASLATGRIELEWYQMQLKYAETSAK